MTKERLALLTWVMLWITLAASVLTWVFQVVNEERHKAYGQCYVVTITENVIAPSIPWYSQLVPVVIGQSVSCY